MNYTSDCKVKMPSAIYTCHLNGIVLFQQYVVLYQRAIMLHQPAMFQNTTG